MYTLHQYGRMIADRVRTEAYAEALRRRVTPGSVVLDMGTGTGIFAILAVRAGARRVYAVDPSPVLRVARQIARDNGVDDRIEFIRGRTDRIDLPERVDGIVSDMRGRLPLEEGHLEAIADARRRHLKPGGWQVPRRDTLRACLLESPALYGEIERPWRENSLGLDLTAGAPRTLNRLAPYAGHPGEKRGPAQALGTLDYAAVESPDFQGRASWIQQEALTAHGMVLWFDAELDEGVGYTSNPFLDEQERAAIYGALFLPFEEPAVLRPEEEAAMSVRAQSIGGTLHFHWELLGAGGVLRRQSTFLGMVVPPGPLERRSADHVPRLGRQGRLQELVLRSATGGRTLGEIADALRGGFPDLYPDRSAALAAAAEFLDPFLEGA